MIDPIRKVRALRERQREGREENDAGVVEGEILRDSRSREERRHPRRWEMRRGVLRRVDEGASDDRRDDDDDHGWTEIGELEL